MASEASPLSVHVNRYPWAGGLYIYVLEATWYSKWNECTKMKCSIMVSVWCMGRGGLCGSSIAALSPDNAIECVVHGCDMC